MVCLSTAKSAFNLMVLSVLAAIFASCLASATAATVAEQRQSLKAASSAMKSAQRFARAKRAEECVAAVEQAAQSLALLQGPDTDRKLRRSVTRLTKQLEKMHGQLIDAGIEIKPLDRLMNPMASGGEPAAQGGGGQVSFAGQIAPLLTSKCGRCHIDGSSGGFSLASYEALMQGSPGYGPVVLVGDGASSPMMQLIASGDMPRGGGFVSPAEARSIVTWINQGAKFDGNDPSTLLRELKPNANAAGAPPKPKTVKLTKPTGKETVSFALDVAPILTQRCGECHNGQRPRAGFSIASAQALLAGSDSGLSILAGDPTESLLLKRVRGDVPPRMPQGRPPLSADQIKTLETWINEGATFDGPDASMSLAETTQRVQVEKSTPAELSELRHKAADRMWHLAVPDETSRNTQTDNYLLLGNLPESRLQQIGSQAEGLLPKVKKLFRDAGGSPFSKAHVTLFLFAKGIDYREFGLMVERMPIPTAQKSHWRSRPLDPYGCLVASASDLADGVLVEPIAATYLAEKSGGRMPAWLVDGAAKAAVAVVAPGDGRIEMWQAKLRSALGSLDKPADLMGSSLPPEDAGVLRYHFAAGLMKDGARFERLIDALHNGQNFAAASKKVYRATPEQLVTLWLRSLGIRK